MTPLRLLVNAIVGGFLLFAWGSLAPGFFGRAYASSGFLVQYLACCAEALLAGWLLWLAAGRVRTRAWRAIFVAALGLFASLVCDLPRWNQGDSTGLWLLGRTLENVLGFTLVGLFLAWRMRTYRFVPSQIPRTR
jgi:hypothetical protein